MNITMELAAVMFPFVKPNTTISVVEARHENGNLILTLEHPNSRRLADFPMVSMLQSNDQVYLILHSQDSYSEPPQSNYGVVKYIDSGRLSTIDYDEFQPLYTQVQLEPEPGTIKQSFTRLFHLPEDQDVINFQDNLRQELTSEIHLGGPQFEPPGTILKVSRRTCDGHDVWIEFANRHGDKNAEFLLFWSKVIAGQSHCVFVYPPQLTADDPVRQKIVLRFRDRDTFEVLSSEALRRVRGDLVAAVDPARKSSVEEIEEILGRIPGP